MVPTTGTGRQTATAAAPYQPHEWVTCDVAGHGSEELSELLDQAAEVVLPVRCWQSLNQSLIVWKVGHRREPVTLRAVCCLSPYPDLRYMRILELLCWNRLIQEGLKKESLITPPSFVASKRRWHITVRGTCVDAHYLGDKAYTHRLCIIYGTREVVFVYIMKAMSN